MAAMLPAPSVGSIAPTSRNQDAVFIGWQQTSSGDLFPLYNILKKKHPSYLSTVTEKTLHSFHLRIPRTPSPYPGEVQSPWHAMGTEFDDLATAGEAIEAAGLNYTVVKRPIEDVIVTSHSLEGSGSWLNIRNDTGEVLGRVGVDYVPIQNRDAFTFFDILVGANEATYETAGELGRGKIVWLLARLPGYIKVRKKDLVAKYVLLTNSHDGSSGVRVKLTPIRAVCNNTLTSALLGEGDTRIRQSRHGAEDIEQALSLLGSSHSLYEELDSTFNRMALTKISDAQLLEYVTALVPDNQEAEDNAANRSIRNAVLELYESGQGAEFSRGTLWGAFNGVTEYADHSMEGDPGTRLESIWFGQGEKLKKKAFRLAEQMM
jgi:phage/plasmid-like protein (TIGR03299 family)